MYVLSVAFAFWSAAIAAVLAWSLLALRPDRIRQLANLLPPAVIVPYVLVAWFLPRPGAGPPTPLVLAIHYSGMALLFAFLVLAFGCQCRIWKLLRSPKATVAEFEATWRIWWAATKLMPAPAALAILISGLRLVYEDPNKGDIARGWPWILFGGFSLMFFDGLLGYLPELLHQYEAACLARAERLTTADYVRTSRHLANEVVLFIHGLSFPFIFAIGAAQPDNLSAPLAIVGGLKALAARCTDNPDGIRVLSAAFLVLSIGLIVVALRLPGLVRHLRFLIYEVPARWNAVGERRP